MRTNVFAVYNDIHQHGAVYAFHSAMESDGLLRAIWLVFVAKKMHQHFDKKHMWITS